MRQQNGKQVWWYFCGGNYLPQPNVYIESPSIDIRVFLGFMSYAYRVDGFLYWSMIWPAHGVKETPASPYTDWDPETVEGWNGDGCLIYAGPGWSPITTVRMENWLDGMEDYEYLKLLEQQIDWLYAHGKGQLAQQLEQQLAVYHTPYNSSNPIVRTLLDHTYDPVSYTHLTLPTN